MPSSLFEEPREMNDNVISAVNLFKAIVERNPQPIFENEYRTNPTFRNFADSLKGKTPDQAFREYGIDFSLVQGLIR